LLHNSSYTIIKGCVEHPSASERGLRVLYIILKLCFFELFNTLSELNEAAESILAFTATDKYSLKELLNMVNSKDRNVRLKAIGILKYREEKAILPVLEKLLNDTDKQVRFKVASALVSSDKISKDCHLKIIKILLSRIKNVKNLSLNSYLI